MWRASLARNLRNCVRLLISIKLSKGVRSLWSSHRASFNASLSSHSWRNIATSTRCWLWWYELWLRAISIGLVDILLRNFCLGFKHRHRFDRISRDNYWWFAVWRRHHTSYRSSSTTNWESFNWVNCISDLLKRLPQFSCVLLLVAHPSFVDSRTNSTFWLFQPWIISSRPISHSVCFLLNIVSSALFVRIHFRVERRIDWMRSQNYSFRHLRFILRHRRIIPVSLLFFVRIFLCLFRNAKLLLVDRLVQAIGLLHWRIWFIRNSSYVFINAYVHINRLSNTFLGTWWSRNFLSDFDSCLSLNNRRLVFT